MLGRLARFMRFAGYDVEYDRTAGDDLLHQKSKRRNTVLLTRDRELAARCKSGRVYFVEKTGAENQLAEIRGRFPVPPGARSRCLVCNLKIRPIARRKVEHLVPPFVYEQHSRFYRCSGCKRVYWKGTHFRHMLKALE
jgi:uncharacterized protein with PIN domain